MTAASRLSLLAAVPVAAGLVGAVSAPSLAAPGVAPKSAFFELTPTAAQVPGGGDTRGNVRAFLQLDGPRNSVCFLITWTGLKGRVTAAHLHRAPAGRTGPHHVDLVNEAAVSGKRGSLAECVDADAARMHGMAADPDAVTAILKRPNRFYLNLHTTVYPEGARRAQLG